MWHASVSSHPLMSQSRTHLLQRAYQALEGVGDASLGEWVEDGEKAVHLRRRCTDQEARRVHGVKDVRETFEGRERAAKMQMFIPAAYRGRVF